MTELQLSELQDWGRKKSREFMHHYNEDYGSAHAPSRKEYFKAYYEAKKAMQEEEQAEIYDFSPDLDSFQVYDATTHIAEFYLGRMG